MKSKNKQKQPKMGTTPANTQGFVEIIPIKSLALYQAK